MRFIKNWKFLLLVIVLIAGFLRLYQLGNVPAGLTNDEASIGWDAYSVLKTGRDQWNNFLPLQFAGFGDYPPSLMRYLSLLPIFIFDLTSFSIRLPSAIAGIGSILAIFLLARKLFNIKIGFFSAFLFAVSPWAVGLNRVAIESSIAILFFLLGIYFYVLSKEKIKYLYLSSLFLAVTIYTYSAYTLFLPLVLLALTVWSKDRIRKNIRNYIVASIILIAILIPNFVFKNSAASVRFSQVGLTNNINSIGLVTELNDKRGECLKVYPSFVCKVLDNKPILFTTTFIKNYTSHFSINLLYNSGTPTQFSILPQRGLEYTFGIVFLIFGLVRIIKNKDKNGYLIIAFFLLSPIPDSLTGDGHYSRASMMLPLLLILEGVGIFSIVGFFAGSKVPYISKLSYIIIVSVILFGAVSFWTNYTSYYKNHYSLYSQYGYEDLMKKVYMLKDRYDKVFISRHLNDTKQYIYYLFYNKIDPKSYQRKNDVAFTTAGNGWISIDRIGNIYFVENPPTAKEIRNLADKKILVISNPVDFPKDVRAVFIIKDKLGNAVFEAKDASDLLEYERTQKLLMGVQNADNN